MAKTVWVFPGQGSQAQNMGLDLLDRPGVRDTFDRAAAILGWSVQDRISGDETDLSQTIYTQPCLYTVECILVDLLKATGDAPDFVAGHSLGEYVALYAAGAIDFETGLRLVKRRGELMQQAEGGQMMAMMKFDRDQLEAAIAATDGVVLANDNSPLQAVISGTPEAVEAIAASVKSRRAIKLNVSGAFHSPLMEPASQDFATVLATVQFNDATIPVMSNVDPSPETAAAALHDRLSRQMTGSVRWREISLSLPDLGVDRVVEVGPGQVLTGLIGRTVSDLELVNIQGADDLTSVTV
ncbi:MAG: [acyl-carrier-protein] S-malonyltransferase [Oscillatoriales cyanobacterium]|nr:MAG: [acyl-carrier-protein] S-malonyltransferase [Oscillatoriales cyanobacterium]